MNKKIIKRIHPVCVIGDCPRQGKPMNVVIYEDHTYRGGHHFSFDGEFEREMDREYWECPQCYRGEGSTHVYVGRVASSN